MIVGRYNYFIDGGISDSALWKIDNSSEGSFILLIDGVAHVSEEVLDFLSLIE